MCPLTTVTTSSARRPTFAGSTRARAIVLLAATAVIATACSNAPSSQHTKMATGNTVDKVTKATSHGRDHHGAAGGPAPVARPGSWRAPRLVMTATSLGSVRIGQTIAQAERASGTPLIFISDYFRNAKWTDKGPVPIGDAGLWASIGASSRLSCVGATLVAGGPTITTSEGFVLGETVTKLKSIYGKRLRFSPPQEGVNGSDSYILTIGGNNLRFWPGLRGTILQMGAGRGFDGPVSC